MLYFLFLTNAQTIRERDTTFFEFKLVQKPKDTQRVLYPFIRNFCLIIFFNAPFFLTHIHRHTNTYNIEIELDYPTVFHEKLLTNDQINAIVYKICF